MQHLKRQIRESFFNPILYFLPALVFMLVDDFLGENAAWKISFPVAFALMFYVFFVYKRMFLWHGVLAVCYLIIGFASSLVPETNFVYIYIDEIIFIFFIFMMFGQKETLERIASKTLPHQLPMSNNENELFKMARWLLIIVLAYVISALIFETFSNINNGKLFYLRIFYALSIIALALFETIRVVIVRDRLIKEDWLPIVDENGKVVGSVQYQPDTPNQERLMHPVVRLYLVDNGRIFMHQRKPDDKSEPLHWDASLSRQVRMSESIESTLHKFTQKFYNLEEQKFLFLTNYIYHGKFSNQYIYLFVTCKTEGLQPQEKELYVTKWWTQKQIDENLGAGVFTERFEKEYGILKRSGLLEISGCDCECQLKDLIREVSDRPTV